jgi:hypothetical protein
VPTFTIQANRYSFDHRTCRDHLNKLVREADRLEQATDRDDKSDHAINGATTGWHLHEWIWSSMKHIERSAPPDASQIGSDVAEQIRLQHLDKQRACATLRSDVAKAQGISVGSVDAEAFGVYMAQHYPCIEACRIIATGSKHTQVGRLPDPQVETFVSANPVTVGSAVDVVRAGVPKIRMGGVTWGASDVIRDACEVWTGLIYGRLKID